MLQLLCRFRNEVDIAHGKFLENFKNNGGFRKDDVAYAVAVQVTWFYHDVV